MKNFRVSFALIALVVATSAFAQGPGGRMGGPGGPGGRPMNPAQIGARIKERQKTLLDKLKLNPSQKKRADALVDQYVERMQKMFKAAGPGGMQGMREKMKPIRDDFDAKLNKILTPAQQAELKKLRAEMRNRMGGPGGRMGGPGGRMGGPGGPGGAGRPGGTPGKP